MLPSDGLTQQGFNSSTSPFQIPMFFLTWVVSKFVLSKLISSVPGSLSYRAKGQKKHHWNKLIAVILKKLQEELIVKRNIHQKRIMTCI